MLSGWAVLAGWAGAVVLVTCWFSEDVPEEGSLDPEPNQPWTAPVSDPHWAPRPDDETWSLAELVVMPDDSLVAGVVDP